MRQAVMTAPGKIEIRQVEKPHPAEGEVLVKMSRIGVCGSDIHVYHGLHPYTSYPVVQGHEVSGVIAETGQGVAGLKPGECVTFMPQVTCGKCYSCRHGMYHICDSLKVMGFQTGGAAQEYFPVAADKVLSLPASISVDQAAMIEPVSVAVHAVRRAGDIAGKKVIVLGAGTIGNLVGQVAKALGAEAVMITDINAFKLQKAAECGIDFCVDTSAGEPGSAIAEKFGADKADVILECVGSQDTISQAIANARKGSTIIIVGVFGKKPVADLGLVQDRELVLKGTLMYQKRDYETAIDLVSKGKIHLNEMISNHFPFDQYLAAFEAIEAAKGNILKVMIDLD